nr:ankyrin repeat domain-containing protein [Wolbachia endosymbiont (group A) of Anomoia purmunda]
MLLDKGAGVDVVDSRGRTPLHWAAQNNNKEIVDALIKAKATVDIKDEDENTPLKLTTNEEIKALFKKAAKELDDANPVDESSTDNEGDPEEDAGTPQGTTSAGQGTDIKAEGVEPVAPTEPAQTEEQPSSFFGSLFSILMKPFSLIASFFGGFFSWLFGSDEPTQSSSESDQSVVLESPSSLEGNDII